MVHLAKRSDDIERYILQGGCVQCTRHATVQRAALRYPIKTNFPSQIIAVYFVGPLPETGRGNRFIMNLVEYFSQYLVAYPSPSDAH